MARSPGQRGTFGEWLTAEREKRYKTQATARAAYRRLRGLTISESEYAQWESGSRVPKVDNPKRLALMAFYGSAPDEPPVTPEPNEMTLVRAISDLVEELRLSRQRQETFDEQVLELIAAATGTPRVPEGSPRDTDPAARAGTAR